MRTTVTLASDVAAAIARIRQEQGLGTSAAINALIRQGLTGRSETPAFAQRTSDGGALIDVTNVADALELLEAPEGP